MVHTFDSNIAAKYGVNAAILLQNLYYWIKKNQANEKHFHNGYYWTYNSIKAFEEMFPYMSTRQIRTALDRLEEEEIIVSGNYNTSTYDRTKWYALTEKAYALINNGESICQNEKMDSSEKSNQFDTGDKPIPDINTDNKPNNNTVSKDTVRQTDVQRCIGAWNSLSRFGIKQVLRVSSGSQRYDRLIARIKQYGVDEVVKAIERIECSSFLQGKSGGKRQWCITFDWFVLPNNFPKVLEGNYDDKEEKEVVSHPPDDGDWQ